jgi:hypothetical protein
MMCGNLLKHKELFEKHFLDILVGLRNDKVVNVKLALAELVKRHMDEKGELSNNDKFLQLFKALKEDENEEINSVFTIE